MGNLCKTVAVRLKYFDATNSGDDPPKGYTRLNLSDTTNIMIDVPSDVVTQFKEIATPADQRKYLFKLSQDLGDNADLLIRAFLLCFITGPSGPDHFITPSTRESSWAQQQQSFVDELEKFCAGEYGKKLDELSPRALEIVNRVTKAVYELVSVRLLPPSSTSIQSQIASFNGGKLFGTYPLVNCPVHGLGSHDGVLLDPRPFRDAKNRDLSIIT
ncbi:hypothetical protein HN928_05115, partial [bacterium]|nr:hypothetical protein [bacterium]